METREIKEHNCRQCKHEFLGRCLHQCHYGKDVSVGSRVCPMFVDTRKPEEVIFSNMTLGQVENYLKEYFYTIDFVDSFTRRQLQTIMEKLFPNLAHYNKAGRAFTHMCKRRMVTHIEFYIKLHNLNCKVKSK